MLKWPQIALDLLTTVPSIIAKVQAANPTTPGADKKLKVMDEIQTALTAAEPIVGDFVAQNSEIMAVFSTIVDASVDLYQRTTAVLASAPPTVPAAALITGAPAIAPQGNTAIPGSGAAPVPAAQTAPATQSPGGSRTGA